jgi:hypothetical protein
MTAPDLDAKQTGIPVVAEKLWPGSGGARPALVPLYATSGEAAQVESLAPLERSPWKHCGLEGLLQQSQEQHQGTVASSSAVYSQQGLARSAGAGQVNMGWPSIVNMFQVVVSPGGYTLRNLCFFANLNSPYRCHIYIPKQ